MSGKLERYSMDLRHSVAPPNHIGITSLYSVTAPLDGTVTGVKGFFSPPFAAGELKLQLDFRADGRSVEDTGNRGKEDCGLLFAGAVWRPDRIVRRGTYHWIKADKLHSFKVVSELTPLTGKAGFVLTVRVTNRSGRALPIALVPTLSLGPVGYVPLRAWDFSPPTGGDIARDASGEGRIWETDAVRVSLLQETPAGEIEHGREFVARLAVVFTEASASAPVPASSGLAGWAQETTDRWEERIARAEAALPRLETDIPGLEAYYRRSLISGLICLWEHPDFKISPLPSVSGIDGGGINCYTWDAAGYVGQMLAMVLGAEKSADFIRYLVEGGIDRHISFAPDGSGHEPFAYSYSLWSFFHFAWSLFGQHGIMADLYPMLERVLEVDEQRLAHRGELLDYGSQHHLLEMRSSGYEHVVASPNAERAWCYDRLADLAEQLGKDEAGKWRDKAAGIRRAIQEELWDRDAGWFKSLYPNGRTEIIYSIQAYDALRMGACTPDMERALLSHLRDGAFLGAYGVSSISAADELHYEVNDPDWSGGGSFAGEGAILAQTLWELGHAQLAWDVFKRHFWMGAHLPYFPQEHYADRPQAPAHKRANNIAGMSGAQAVIFGLAGIRPQPDGSLIVCPQPPEEGCVALRGFSFRGRSLDVSMKPGYCEIKLDGKTLYEGAPRSVTL